MTRSHAPADIGGSEDPLRVTPRPDFQVLCHRFGIRPTRNILEVAVPAQRLRWWEGAPDGYQMRSQIRISTSRFGIGQVENSNRTPLGLHRIARKIGGGTPVGTVFRSRQRVGLKWQGHPTASIVHRILWLEGLEPGFNRGANVDTFRRYIYIHGFGDESTLGRPQSHGCVHLCARDLIPLYDFVPEGTLVWIHANGRPTAPFPSPTKGRSNANFHFDV